MIEQVFVVNPITVSGGSSDINLLEVGGNPIALGQTTSANSLPVVLASDQSPIPVTVSGGGSGSLQLPPISLFTATTAGTSLSKTLWPGTYTVALPAIGSGLTASISSSGNVIGGVVAPAKTWDSFLLDYAGVGSASKPMTLEIGRLAVNGAMTQVLGSVALTTGSTASIGPISVNPFTAVATAPTTYQLFDLTTITSKGQLGQILQSIGGLADNTPSQLSIACKDAQYYYVIITALDVSFSSVIAAVTPQ